MKKHFSSLDQYRRIYSDYDEPDRIRHILNLGEKDKIIAQGAAISYVSASFGYGTRSINMRRFDRILGFDPENQMVEVEAGTSLGKLYYFLFDRGFYLNVQPGHPQITIGGCIATNAHGKNQYVEGCFHGVVNSIKLFHPSHGIMRISNNEHPELFDLTIGGFGLTGIIISARLNIVPLRRRQIKVRHIPVPNLEKCVEKLWRLKTSAAMLYSWNDLSRPILKHGRGFVVSGTHIESSVRSDESRRKKVARIDPHKENMVRFPVMSSPLLFWTNETYYQFFKRTEKVVDLYDFLYPIAHKSLYYRAFGKKGFLENQTLVPEGAVMDYLSEFTKIVGKHQQQIALFSMKCFHGIQKLLYFDGKGISITINIANTTSTLDFMDELDSLNCEFGAITNLIKDSRISAQTAEQQYSGIHDFRKKLSEHDPQRLFMSELSKRLRL